MVSDTNRSDSSDNLPDPIVYKAEEIGAMLRVHPDYVRKMMREGQIGYVKIGRFHRVTQAQLDDFLKGEQHQQESA